MADRLTAPDALAAPGGSTAPASASDETPTGTVSPIRDGMTAAVWLTLVAVLIADGLDLIDSTVTNVAAPSIAAELGGGPGLVKWLGATYSLTLGSLLVVGGRLGDRLGQRRVFLGAMAAFLVASAMAGFALSPAMILAARVLQGAAGAMLIPQGMAIMTRSFSPSALRVAFSAFGPMLGVFGVGGPLLAGFLIDADLLGLGWRPVFLVNLVLGGIGLALGVRYVPRLPGDPEVRIDLAAAVLLAASVFGLLFGLIEASDGGWSAGPVIALGAGAALFAGFVRRQATGPDPLVAPSLLAKRSFTSGLVAGLLIFAAFTGLMYVISLFLQLGLGYSPGRAAVNLLPLTVGIIVASGISMAVGARLGRLMVLGGLVLTMAGGTGLLVLVGAHGLDQVGWHLAVATFVIGMGAGACFASIFATALGDVSADEAGAASGSLSAIQQVAAGIGSAAVTSVFFAAAHLGQAQAMVRSLAVVLVICTVCLAAVPMLPRRAAELEH